MSDAGDGAPSRGARVRPAVRAIVLSDEDEVLLMRFLFPRVAVWLAPGGGLQPGEPPRDGLRRELAEETGRDGWTVGPQLWHRITRYDLGRGTVEQRERYYLVRTARFEPPSMLPDPAERRWFDRFGWWRIEAIARSPERFAPRCIARHLRRLLDHGVPRVPIDVSG